MGVIATARVGAPSVGQVAHSQLGPQPPRAELSFMRGILVGLLLVLPFWLAVLAWLIRL